MVDVPNISVPNSSKLEPDTEFSSQQSYLCTSRLDGK